MIFGLTTPARAQGTIVVNTVNDETTPGDGTCSLREAIQNANANAQTSPDCAAGSGNDSISFQLGQSPPPIALNPSLGPLTITDPAGLTINGGQESIVISGGDSIQVFENTNAKLAVINLTIAHGFANITDPNVQGDRGGGIKNDGGTLTVTSSTFLGNNALFIGGGIANINGGTLEVTNSTFSGNRAGSGGGGIVNAGTLEVTNSTFSGNGAELIGGGIQNANVPTAKVTLSNTILANSANGNIGRGCVGTTCQGTITDGGYNISDDSSSVSVFTNPTSKNSTNPLLDPSGLQNNGGPTQTIALQVGSPAIDYIPEGQNGCGTSITVDQRGVKRPQGKACDVGAYELKQQAEHHKAPPGGKPGGVSREDGRPPSSEVAGPRTAPIWTR